MSRTIRRSVRHAALAGLSAMVLSVAIAGPALADPAPSQTGTADPQAAKAQLDSRAQTPPNARTPGGGVPAEVATWWVDVPAGKLVVEVVGPETAASKQFTSGIDASVLRVQAFSEPVKLFADLIGGQAIYAASGGRCSIGFSAVNSAGAPFVITAGHCTELGGTWSGTNRTAIGPVSRTNFPGSDFGSIQVTNRAAWTPTAKVEGGPTVKGSTRAAIGAQVCRSGSTTGYRCGTVEAYDQTVNYGGGDVVTGLTRTNACAERGDSGGTFITPQGQAQGMTSGGSGNCTVGGRTFFEPVGDALSAYGLRLVTG